jgi:hypothetical protein
MEGEVLGGRFRLGRLAGAGAMGQVYEAVDTEGGRRVAIKLMPEKSFGSAARFVREARILADLAHPHIVGYVAHGTTGADRPWLAMEWLEGEDLAARLARGPLSRAESVDLAILLAETLGFVHARGIIHRDLKPSNVFLAQGDLAQARLLDFGIARREAGEQMTRQGMLLGTPGYMAPEQVHGASAIDGRADLYALGCMLFECLTGRPLFSGANVLAILAKVVLEPAPRLRDALPDVAASLDELVTCLLAKNPDDRPDSGSAVAAALRAYEGGGETAVSVPPLASPTPRFLTGSERRAVAVILIGAGGAVARGDAPTALPDTIDPETEGALRTVAVSYGGRLVRLLTGAVAVELTSPGLATDLAAQAARCALSLRPLAGGRRVAVAMGRDEPSGELPRGPAIDRGAKLLAERVTADENRASLARAGDDDNLILLDEVVAGLLDARFDVRDTAGAFVLGGERPVAEGARTLLGKATPCVGRDRELALLHQIFEQCMKDGSAQAALVTGPAGVGKSRLAQELLRLVRARSAGMPAVWVGRGDSLRTGSAFGLLGQLLRGACQVQEGASLERRQQRVRATVAELLPGEPHAADRTRLTEFLGEIVGSPFPDEGSLPLRAARKDPSLMNEQMRAAFLTFVDAACGRGPLLILLEDLHWADQPTVQFIDRALAVLRDRPLLVLALARPGVRDRFPRLWAELGSHEIHLKELGARAIDRLVRHVLGEDATSATIDRLARLSEGNAFYLEELIRWSAQRRGSDLPETVVTMVQSRLGALDEAARSALRVASIFGEVFWSGAVSALLGGRERTTSLRDRLRELAEQELLVKRPQPRFPEEDEYAFRHALLREGAYAMLTEDDRELGHRLAGEWLEAHGETDVLLLAEHFEKGGDGVRAARLYLLAAKRANAGSDTWQALECLRRGLALPLPQDLRLELLGLRCELHMYRVELALQGLPDAQALLKEADPGSVAWTQGLLVSLIGTVMTGDAAGMAQAFDVALDVAFRPDAVEVATILLGFGAAFAGQAGQMRKSEALVKRAEALLRPYGDREIGATLFYHLIVTTRAAFGDEDPWNGLEHARRALALAQSIGHRRYTLGSQMFVLVNSCFMGAYEEVRRAANEVDVPDHEFGLSSSVRPFVLAWHLADLGELEAARAWAERLQAAGRSRGRPLDEARGDWALAEVLRRMGETERARDALGRAQAVIEKVCPLDVPAVLATGAALHLAEGRRDLAVAAADEGMGKYRAMGACGMFRGAFLRLTHAEALHAVGRLDEAYAAIAEARQRLLENADKIGDLMLRDSFLRQVPENRRILELAATWSARG